MPPPPDRRRDTGRIGEEIAVRFLRRRGVSILARNLSLADGEIDVLASEGGRRVVVEVRTITGQGRPADAFGPAKADQVWRLARSVGAERVDLVGIRLSRGGAEVHWVRGVA